MLTLSVQDPQAPSCQWLAEVSVGNTAAEWAAGGRCGVGVREQSSSGTASQHTGHLPSRAPYSSQTISRRTSEILVEFVVVWL